MGVTYTTAAANTYVPIATQTLGSTAATVTFSSIVNSYTDLFLQANIKGTSGSASYLYLNLNGDTATNYSQTSLYGNGTSAGSSRNANTAVGYLAQNANINTTNLTYYGINFQNYTNTTTYKTMLTRLGSADLETEAVVTLWRSTAAINQIVFAMNLGSFAAGSVFSLYGIKGA